MNVSHSPQCKREMGDASVKAYRPTTEKVLPMKTNPLSAFGAKNPVHRPCFEGSGVTTRADLDQLADIDPEIALGITDDIAMTLAAPQVG